jgi:hypothetical protein
VIGCGAARIAGDVAWMADEEAAKAGWGQPGDVPAEEVVICCGLGQFRYCQVSNVTVPNRHILHTMRSSIVSSWSTKLARLPTTTILCCR